jgi:signal transduction histidine kinase
VADVQGTLDEMKAWVGYGPADTAVLEQTLPVVVPHVARIVDRFYDEVQKHPGANDVFDGPEQVERLKRTLRVWLVEVFEGPHDADYAERRRAIGWRHVQVGLPDRYMFTAMHVVESELVAVFRDELREPWPAADAVRKVLTLDLALMTGTYVEARELKQLDTLQALLVEHLRVVVLLVGDDGRVRSATRATATLLSGRDVQHLDWREALPEGLLEAAELERHTQRALERHREVTLPRIDVGDRSYRVHVVPLHHELASFLLQVEELTDAVEMEARLRRSEALAQLGALSAAVAHELRNPLAGISGALQVITRSMDEGSLHHTVLTKVDGEVRRLNSLVTDLLAFARPGTAQLTPTDLRPLADEVVELLAPEHPTVTLSVVGLGQAAADPHLVRQVLHNLVRNAVDAVTESGGGAVRVLVDHGSLRVADDGPGIPEERRAEVFEPFVTSKTRGTGLGLAISARSAHAMGGDLRLVDDGPLSGACFELLLTTS